MVNYIVTPVQFVIGIVGIVSFIILVFLIFLFGRLMKHQTKLKLMAKRGYTQIRHIREDMVENYFFLRINNDHYEFDQGIYMEQKDVKTKSRSILAPLDYKLLCKKPEDQLSAEEKQIKSFLRSIENSKVMDITTLSWGIPTITYYANDPNPVNVKERKKVYDAKNIAAMIKRLLLTKEWKLVRMVLILTLVGFGLMLLLAFLYYGMGSKNATNLNLCLGQLNVTTNNYLTLLNTTQQQTLNQVVNNASKVILI